MFSKVASSQLFKDLVKVELGILCISLMLIPVDYFMGHETFAKTMDDFSLFWTILGLMGILAVLLRHSGPKSWTE